MELAHTRRRRRRHHRHRHHQHRYRQFCMPHTNAGFIITIL